MAEIATLDPTLASPPPPASPSPRPPGRPKGSAQLPKGPSPVEVDQRTIFEYVKGLTPAEWESRMVYVYRWDPIHDATDGGQRKKYVTRYSSAFDEEQMKKEDLGSGTYNLQLVHTPPGAKAGKMERQATITIFDMKYPPLIPPGDWLDHPRNKKWTWARGPLEKLFNVGAAAAQNANGGNVPAWAVQLQRELDEIRRGQHTPDMTGAVFQVLPKLIEQSQNAQDPAKMIGALKDAKEFLTPAAGDGPQQTLELIKAIKELAPAKDDTMLKFFMERASSAEQRAHELMKVLLETKTQQTNPVEQLRGMMEVFTMLNGLKGAPATGGEWQQLAETLGGKALDTWQEYLRWKAAQPASSARPAARANEPARSEVASGTSGTAAGSPAAAAPDSNPGLSPNEVTMLAGIASYIVQALNLGLDGGQFADQVCHTMGSQTYEAFIDRFPKDTVLEQFRAVPEAWKLLAPQADRLPKFIEEFYAPPDENPDPDPDEAPAAAPAGAPKRKKK